MACNSCAKSFTLFRKEKGCPSCGYSYCSTCLDNKIFVKKYNCYRKVCSKCKHSSDSEQKKIVAPPDAYYKRIGVIKTDSNGFNNGTIGTSATDEIEKRLQNLKKIKSDVQTDEDIANRLQNIRSIPSTSDAELQSRLSNLKGLQVTENYNKPLHWSPKNKSEQEEADELLKCYTEQASIDKKYEDRFNEHLSDIESRLLNLRGNTVNNFTKATETQDDSEDEAEIKKIIQKVKVDSLLHDVGDGISLSNNDELPFCEICNEDARMKCLGCKYLFCKTCFLEHKDDEDGCDRYEPYEPPKTK